MITDKVAVVTGGSRGIGLATARTLLQRRRPCGDHGDLRRHSSRGHGRAGQDIGKLSRHGRSRRCAELCGRWSRPFRAWPQRFGGIDVVVNNAGVGAFGAVADMTIEEWRQVIDTNLSVAYSTGAGRLCRTCERRGGGWIINISSLASTNPFRRRRRVLRVEGRGRTRSARRCMQEVRHDGIRVACVLPGSVRTEFMGRSSSSYGVDWKLAPDDVAQVVVDLVAHPARSLPSRVEIRPAQARRKKSSDGGGRCPFSTSIATPSRCTRR